MPLFLGLVCGVVVFLVIVVLNMVLPSPGNLKIAATAGIFAGSIEAFIAYYQRKKQRSDIKQG